MLWVDCMKQVGMFTSSPSEAKALSICTVFSIQPIAVPLRMASGSPTPLISIALSAVTKARFCNLPIRRAFIGGR